MRRSKEESEISKLRILDAAEQEFRRCGFASASLDAIAVSAGLTKGAIFWHFRSKIGLFTAVVDRTLALVTETSQEVFASSATTSSMEVGREIIKRLNRNKVMNVFLVMADAEKTGSIPKALFSEYLKKLDGVIHKAVERFAEKKLRGELRHDAEPTTILLTITVVMFGFAKLHEIIDARPEIREHFNDEAIVDAVFDGLLSFQAKKN